MKKASIAITVIFILIAGYMYLNFRNEEQMDSERQQSDDAKNELMGKVGDACKSAISSTNAPRKVLNFSFNYGFNDIPGFAPTDTGYSFRVIADFGDEKIRYKCYMDENFRILKMVTE